MKNNNKSNRVTLGYGDVIPSDAVTRSLACIQVVIGVGWVTVVLSAAAALARPKVNQMLAKVWQEEGEVEPEGIALQSKGQQVDD